MGLFARGVSDYPNAQHSCTRVAKGSVIHIIVLGRSRITCEPGSYPMLVLLQRDHVRVVDGPVSGSIQSASPSSSAPFVAFLSLVPSSRGRSNDSFLSENPVPSLDPASGSLLSPGFSPLSCIPTLQLLPPLSHGLSLPPIISDSTPLSLENAKTRSLPRIPRPSVSMSSGISNTRWFGMKPPLSTVPVQGVR